MHKSLLGLSILSVFLWGCCGNCVENEKSRTLEQSSLSTESAPPRSISSAQLSETATNKTTVEDLISVFYFDYDQSSLDEVSKKLLNPVAAYLKANPSQKIVIVGNTDIRGPHQYNQALGQQRANAVQTYLASQGVPVAQMSAISRGKENPLSLNDSEQAQAMNRRVEILFERP